MNFLEEKQKKILKWLFLIQLILLYLPTLTFFTITTDNGTIPASACYFYSLVFIPLLWKNFKEKGLKLPPIHITGLVVYTLILAIIRMGQYGLSKNVLHWLFGFYLSIIVINLGQYLSKEEWICIFEWGALAFLVMHFILMLSSYEFVWLLCKNYFLGLWDGCEGCFLPSLTRGGRNLDATWLALGSLFVRGRKKGFYVTYVILFSFLGGSRVGILAIMFACIWGLIYEKGYKLCKENFKWYVLYATGMLVVLFATGFAQATLSRVMIDIAAPGEILNMNAEIVEIYLGAENSSEVVLSGRKDIWDRVPQMVKDNPFGYGVGNAVRVMRTQYGFSSYEDIIHNVFLQWLVDGGIIGGLWYILLVGLLLFRKWKNRWHFFENRQDGFLTIYIILSLVQFHGGEALMIYVLGTYFLVHDTKYIFIPNFNKEMLSKYSKKGE